MITPAKDGVDGGYLGDGAYVQMDPNWRGQLWVTAENGIRVLEKVALEKHALQQLVDYARKHGWEIK